MKSNNSSAVKEKIQKKVYNNDSPQRLPKGPQENSTPGGPLILPPVVKGLEVDQSQSFPKTAKQDDPTNIQLNVGDASLRGIKLSYLYDVFITEENFAVELRFKFKQITLTEFLKEYYPTLMKSKLDSKKDVFFSDYLEQNNVVNGGGHSVVGDGDVYIACELKNNFIYTMNTLKDHFRRTPDIHVCIDSITHRTPTIDTGKVLPDGNPLLVLDIDLYENRIRDVGYVVVVMSPWNNIGFFRRTAVLFEVYSAIYHGCRVDVALSLKEKERLIECVKNGGVKIIQEALEWIDFAKSESGFKSLHDLVKDKVKPHDVANLSIINVVRDCLTSISNSSEYDLQSFEYTKEVSAVRLTMKDTIDLKEKLLDWARKIDSLDSTKNANYGESYLDTLYESLKNLIFFPEKEVLGKGHDNNDIEFLNKEVFQSVMREVGMKNQSIFSIYSDIIAGVLGKRHPMSLKFHDLYIYSLFLSALLVEKGTDKFFERKLQEAEDKLHQLMMLWESEIDQINDSDGASTNSITITFKTPLPLSYYRYMHKSKNPKLLLLCLKNTDYGGTWRITWIGISRTMVRCECTSGRIASNDIPEKVNMKVDWEIGETFKRSLSVGMSVIGNFKGQGTWYPGKISCVNDDGSYSVVYDDRRTEDNVSAAFVGVKLSAVTYDKFVYLQKRKNPATTPKGKKWNPKRAFFAPIPKLYCSCKEYTLLGVDLVKQVFQAGAVFEFRLNEIGKDVNCERYVLEYLSRYGFDLKNTIDFRDEITSNGSGGKETVEQFILYEESSSKSFMYDYTIQLRKQSEYTADGLQLHNFPFDQQKLSLSIALNSSKLHIELAIDNKSKVDDSERSLHKLREKRIQEESQKKGEDVENLFGNEYKLIFYDRNMKKPWMRLTEKKSQWQMTYSIFIQRRFYFYMYSTVMPLIMFCLLSFLTFGVMNDCTEIDTATRSTITLTLLLSAVAFKVSAAASLPQVPYFTFLDSIMWLLTGFISLLSIENIAWPAATCTNRRLKLGHDEEVYVMYGMLILLVALVGIMGFIAWKILEFNKLRILKYPSPVAAALVAESTSSSTALSSKVKVSPQEFNSVSKR